MSIDRDGTGLRNALRDKLRARLRGKAKPIGSLGRLENLAEQIGMIRGSLDPKLGAAKILVFAGDHGLTEEGVTAYPSAVTREIAKLIVAGSAGINVLARAAGVGVELVDAGMLEPLPPHELLLDRRIGNGTRNSRREPAMSVEECRAALDAGGAIDALLGQQQVDIVGYGEIGIGNTSAAALVAHVLTGIDLAILVGPGAGAPPLGLDHKRRVLSDVLARASIDEAEPAARTFEALQAVRRF